MREAVPALLGPARWDDAEVAAASELAQLLVGLVPLDRRPGGFPHGVSERDEIITTGGRGFELSIVADHVPAARCGQATCVLLAQIVRVGLGERGQRTDNRGRIGIDIGQRRDGLPGTAIAGAASW